MAKELEFDEEYLNLLSKPWQKFFKKFIEIETLSVIEWKPVHLLAYFYLRYKKHFGQPFSISVRGAPSKCSEIYMIKRIMATLGTSNTKIVKEYIDWIFDVKIIPNNKKIRSLVYLANTIFCNQFNNYKAEAAKIYRHTQLPIEYKKIAESMDIPATTFGDLAFAKFAMDSNNDQTRQYKALFIELYRIGFEFDMIKDLR